MNTTQNPFNGNELPERSTPRRRRTVAKVAALVGALAGVAAMAAGPLGGGGTATAASGSKAGAAASAQPRTRAAATGAEAAAALPAPGGRQVHEQLHKAGQTSVNGTGQWTSMEDFMNYVVADAELVWTWYYGQWGYSFTSKANYVFPLAGTSVATGCGDVTNDRTMEYCPNDDTVYFSQALATALWDASYVGPDGNRGSGGDFAVATMLAHEYGHNVQAELGITSATYGVPLTEQHADCFSGAFAHVAWAQGILDADDRDQALATAFAVGDSLVDNPQHHGDGGQRMAAWRLGYDGAGPAACDSILK